MTEDDLGSRKQLFDVNSRISRIEKRINTVGDELHIVRSDAVDKHKAALKQVSDAKAELARLGNEIIEAKKLMERTTHLLGEFASKESVKVLEKYINMWRPIEYITRQEAEALIADAAAKTKKKASRKPATKRAKTRKKKVPGHYSYTL